ncbi:unnamed protein product, partial [Parascedosporium putredinis]
NTSPLLYFGQSGALNEHISDVFGIIVKQVVEKEDAASADWLVGEGCIAPGVKGVALRSMKAPGTAYDDPRFGKDPQPDHFKYYRATFEDNGGVHIYSGIPNKAFYLCSTAFGECTFLEFATATITAARSQFGAEAAKVVKNAWKAVGPEPYRAAYRRFCEERTFFKDINLSKDVRWPLATGSPVMSWEKVFLLAQMQLSGGEWPSTLHKARRKELMAEKKDIFKVLNRIVRCTIDIVGSKKDGEGTSCGLELLRCLEAGFWELQGVEIRQVVSIGPKMGAKLAEAGITTTKVLAKMESWNMQRVMGKNVPFATAMFHRMKVFPILAMDVTQAGRLPEDEGVAVIKASLRYENKQVPTWKGLDIRVVFWAERESDKTLVYFWRRKIRRLEGTNGVDVVFGAGLPAAEYVRCYFSCEEVVGTIVQQTIEDNYMYVCSLLNAAASTACLLRASSSNGAADKANTYQHI